MKKHPSVTKAGVFCASLLAMICMNNSSPAFGQATPSLNAGITYTGPTEKGVNFNIDFKTADKEKIVFEVLDSENHLLFSKKYDTSFNENVHIGKSGDYDWGNDDMVTFVFKSGKKEYKKTFVISKNTRR